MSYDYPYEYPYEYHVPINVSPLYSPPIPPQIDSLPPDSSPNTPLKSHVHSLYVDLCLLHDFSSLNYTGLSKLLKKHDKVLRAFPLLQLKRRFFTSSFVLSLAAFRLPLTPITDMQGALIDAYARAFNEYNRIDTEVSFGEALAARGLERDMMMEVSGESGEKSDFGGKSEEFGGKSGENGGKSGHFTEHDPNSVSGNKSTMDGNDGISRSLPGNYRNADIDTYSNSPTSGLRGAYARLRSHTGLGIVKSILLDKQAVGVDGAEAMLFGEASRQQQQRRKEREMARGALWQRARLTMRAATGGVRKKGKGKGKEEGKGKLCVWYGV